ncbi:MAG: hypothetical protein U0X20_03325 [Caldilineaceae bacterium]
MRFAAQQTQNELDWSILDVEPEEWDRRMADLGVTAAANGFPVYVAAQAVTNGQQAEPRADNLRRIGVGRCVLLLCTGVLVLAMLVSYSVWRTAQAGIVRMQGDVANAVKLETIKSHGNEVAANLYESVQSVEFLGDNAMAMVAVTHTLPSGKVLVQVEARFYQQRPLGWQQTEPVAEFWGRSAMLDTESLHFIFGDKDRVVVEKIAPAAEAIYATLRRATGHDSVTDGLLTVEIVPGYVAQNAQVEAGRIRLASPLLYRATPLADADALGQLRRLLAEQMLSAALPESAVKAQWLTMSQAFGSWLEFSAPPASDSRSAALRRLRFLSYGSLPLDELQDGVVRYDFMTQSMRFYYQPGTQYELEQRSAAAEQLIQYIATTYGIDVLPKLLQGFAQYDDWESMAPAVLGVSAGELDAAWHAAQS